MKDRFDDLVGGADDLPREERERLRRMHDLLLAVDAPAEVPEGLREAPPLEVPRAPAPVERPARRRPRLTLRPAFALAAAAVAALAFGSGYLVGDRDVEPVSVIEMKGVGQVRDAIGTIELLPDDESGNWPMRVVMRGLEPSANREDYYELWLTRGGRLAESCGRFTVHAGVTTVTLSVPYGLRAFDEWVVTRHGSNEVLLSTSRA